MPLPQLEHIEAIEKRLWTAADTLRANSNYASNEYFLPVMGLVFLRHAYSRYLAVKDTIKDKLPTRGGVCPEGMEYRFIQEKPVIEISFSQIVWPESIRSLFRGLAEKNSPSNSFCISASLNNLHTLYNNSVVRAIEADGKIERNLKKFRKREPELSHLFDAHVGRYEAPRPNGRNKHLVDSGNRLLCRVGLETAIKLQLATYDIYEPIFHDSKKQHERESREMMKLAHETYLNNLPELDRLIYKKLPTEFYRDAFRILRDLAYRNSEKLFFMPCCSLKLRIGLKYDIEAHRLLKKFIYWEIIILEKVGQKRESGGEKGNGILFSVYFSI